MHHDDEALLKERDEIIKALPTRSPIYLPTEKIPLADQVEGLQQVKHYYDFGLQETRDRLRVLRNRFKGHRRAFIIGNGPSLNDTDLSLLKDEVTFCVNGFFLKMPELDWTPTFHVVEDHLVAEDRASSINSLTGPIKLYPVYLRYCIEPDHNTIFFNHRPRISYPDGFDFSTNADEITYTGCTVTFTCMQLAHWLGFEELYLIGVDASYSMPQDLEKKDSYGTSVLDMKSDDPNHFDPNYFGKGYRWHDPQVDKMVEAYEEARRVTDSLGRPIRNATVGGQLEVFERVDFNSLFEGSSAVPGFERALKSDDPPKVCVLDMVPLGEGTATGELKSSLFKPWPDTQILAVSATGGDKFRLTTGGIESETRDVEDVLAQIDSFAPDVLLYRPTGEKAYFHDAANSIIKRTKAPVVSWIMDNWLDRAKTEVPDRAARLERDFRWLLGQTVRNISISPQMSRAFETRFGVSFVDVANGIEREDWPAREKLAEGRLVLRYAGGLSPYMGLETVLKTARAVEKIREKGVDVVLEIKTRPFWAERWAAAFEGMAGTVFITDDMSIKDYRRWLREADACLIAYNFDVLSRSYVQYSLANKLPEVLASGAKVIAIGPDDFATIQAAAKVPGVSTITDPDTIEAELSRIISARGTWLDDGEVSRKTAFAIFSLEERQARFLEILRDAAQSPQRQPDDAGQSVSSLHPGTGQGLQRGGAVNRLRRFYGGRRGILPGAAVLLASLPALIADDVIEFILLLGMPAGLAMTFAVIGNWFSQIDQ